MKINEVKDKLLPCLHCGSIPDVYFQNYSGDTFVGEQFLIECRCGIGSVEFAPAEKIISDWNRQA